MVQWSGAAGLPAVSRLLLLNMKTLSRDAVLNMHSFERDAEMKKILLLFTVISLMIGVCGCGMKSQDKIDRMLAYINNKYADDAFEFVSVTGGHLGSNVAKILVKSKMFPDNPIRVICTESDGAEHYTDTYLNVKYEAQTLEYIKQCISSVYGSNIYVEYCPDDTASMQNGTSDTSFNEFISDPSTFVYFSAVVVNKVENETIEFEKIKGVFSEAVIRADIYFVDYSDLPIERLNEVIENRSYTKKLSIIKKTIDDYSKVEWKAGA